MGEFPCSRSSSKAANRRGKWRLEPGTAQPCPPWQGTLTAQNWIIGGKKWAYLEEKRGLEINRQRFEGLEGPWVNELPSLRCDSDQKKTTWGVELSSPTKWTVTSIIWLLALSEPAAQRNGEGGDGRHLTIEMMLAVLPLSLDFERLTSKYCDSPNVIISISQLIHLRSVSQSLCLISLTFYNYVFRVDQLSQNMETNYHHYLQLFFTFSLSISGFWLSLPVSRM